MKTKRKGHFDLKSVKKDLKHLKKQATQNLFQVGKSKWKRGKC